MAHGQVDGPDAHAPAPLRAPHHPILLVGVSGGRGSGPALSAAAELSRERGMSVVVAYVRPMSWSVTGLCAVGAVILDDEEAELEVITLASRILDAGGVPWHFAISSGDPARGLAHLAEVHDAALVVVGDPRPQRGGLWEWFAAPVGRRLQRVDRRPVLTVPATPALLR